MIQSRDKPDSVVVAAGAARIDHLVEVAAVEAAAGVGLVADQAALESIVR